MRCRKRRNVTETRLQSLAWDPAEARPAYGLGGDRHKGGVISVQALAGNVGTWSHDAKGKVTRGRPPRAKVPKRGTGSDQPIVAWKPGNAGGAKGLNGSAEGMDQPERGGIYARSEVVRDFQTGGLGSVPEGQGQPRRRRGGWSVHRGFEKDLKNNLYKIWNRMSSGSYFPPPVRLVEIPKASGGLRPLGIPTVADRVAQMVVKMHLEPLVEPYFHADSYGYRPGKSALDAVATARQRCWR